MHEKQTHPQYMVVYINIRGAIMRIPGLPDDGDMGNSEVGHMNLGGVPEKYTSCQ